jgi:hypothetical protein
VPPGDVPARVDHDHQGCADGKWGQRAAAEHAGGDRENEEERPDELDGVLPPSGGRDYLGGFWVSTEVQEVKVRLATGTCRQGQRPSALPAGWTLRIPASLTMPPCRYRKVSGMSMITVRAR